MAKNSEISALIIETVESSCDDKSVKELIKESLQYELDIWNRHVLPSTIKEEYDQIVDKIIKRV
ncbi:hypothetical protein C4573_06470 [Candidatus Woesearchaeota archaeon]|nr:MAG: hypothetical protein C4573_06470 [Candidatus Woesearchaeota archaeon]